MSNPISLYIKASKVKREIRVSCPFEKCRHVSRSYHALRIHIAHHHKDQPHNKLVRKQLGMLDKIWREVK